MGAASSRKFLNQKQKNGLGFCAVGILLKYLKSMLLGNLPCTPPRYDMPLLQIITRIDDMAARIDDLESNINDLMVQAGQNETSAIVAESK